MADEPVQLLKPRRSLLATRLRGARSMLATVLRNTPMTRMARVMSNFAVAGGNRLGQLVRRGRLAPVHDSTASVQTENVLPSMPQQAPHPLEGLLLRKPVGRPPPPPLPPRRTPVTSTVPSELPRTPRELPVNLGPLPRVTPSPQPQPVLPTRREPTSAPPTVPPPVVGRVESTAPPPPERAPRPLPRTPTTVPPEPKPKPETSTPKVPPEPKPKAPTTQVPVGRSPAPTTLPPAPTSGRPRSGGEPPPPPTPRPTPPSSTTPQPPLVASTTPIRKAPPVLPGPPHLGLAPTTLLTSPLPVAPMPLLQASQRPEETVPTPPTDAQSFSRKVAESRALSDRFDALARRGRSASAPPRMGMGPSDTLGLGLGTLATGMPTQDPLSSTPTPVVSIDPVTGRPVSLPPEPQPQRTTFEQMVQASRLHSQRMDALAARGRPRAMSMLVPSTSPGPGRAGQLGAPTTALSQTLALGPMALPSTLIAPSSPLGKPVGMSSDDPQTVLTASILADLGRSPLTDTDDDDDDDVETTRQRSGPPPKNNATGSALSTSRARKTRLDHAARLASVATGAWWPTWTDTAGLPPDEDDLAERFDRALEIVALRAVAVRTPAETKRLGTLERIEQFDLADEGSNLVLDRLLKRPSATIPTTRPSGARPKTGRLANRGSVLGPPPTTDDVVASLGPTTVVSSPRPTSVMGTPVSMKSEEPTIVVPTPPKEVASDIPTGTMARHKGTSFDPNRLVRMRNGKTVLAAWRSKTVSDRDLQTNPQLRKMLMDDLDTKERTSGLTAEIRTLRTKAYRLFESTASTSSRHDVPEIAANAPREEKARLVRAISLAGKAQSAWWPTWTQDAKPPPPVRELVNRFARALRIVELRDDPARTSEKTRELTGLMKLEIDERDHEGSNLVLDRLLGRTPRAQANGPSTGGPAVLLGRAMGLAQTARQAWWPTWTSEAGPPPPTKELAARFARGLRIVELRDNTKRSPNETTELRDLMRAEIQERDSEGSNILLDRLLGRSSRQVGGAPTGVTPSDMSVVQDPRFSGSPILASDGSGSPSGSVTSMSTDTPHVLLSSTAQSPRSSDTSSPTSTPLPTTSSTPSTSLAKGSDTTTTSSDAPLKVPPPPAPPSPEQVVQRQLQAVERMSDKEAVRFMALMLKDRAGDAILRRALELIEAQDRISRLREVR